MVKWISVIAKLSRMVFKLLILLFLAGLFVFVLPRLITALYASSRTYSIAAAPARRAAIVFGAGIWKDGSPTPVLRDRVATAAELYRQGKVEKLLMSGDNSSIFHNEPEAMRQYALSLGIPDEDIVLDYAGRRTYDTCYRARSIFGLQEAILVTQAFHLPRAVYTCNMLNLPAVGVKADQRQYRQRSLIYWNAREVPATLAALWELHAAHPTPILGEPEPIFPLEAQ